MDDDGGDDDYCCCRRWENVRLTLSKGGGGGGGEDKSSSMSSIVSPLLVSELEYAALSDGNGHEHGHHPDHVYGADNSSGSSVNVGEANSDWDTGSTLANVSSLLLKSNNNSSSSSSSSSRSSSSSSTTPTAELLMFFLPATLQVRQQNGFEVHNSHHSCMSDIL